MSAPIKIYGLLGSVSSQEPLIQKFCFGTCGKLSMAGAITDEQLGVIWVCCEDVCPHLKKQMSEPFGKTNSFEQEHEVYLRTLVDYAQETAQ